jgi:K+-sensing histidine kinase KdpD
MNFSDNALHYSDTDMPVEIQLGLKNFGKTVRVGVRDYGPALPADTLDTLENKLHKTGASIFARPQSSGLGIHIARQFADAMSGKIGITRHRDGSTFYVELPSSQQLSLL